MRKKEDFTWTDLGGAGHRYGVFLQLEFLNYLTWVGEPASFTFGEHQLIICDNVKDAVAPGD